MDKDTIARTGLVPFEQLLRNLTRPRLELAQHIREKNMSEAEVFPLRKKYFADSLIKPFNIGFFPLFWVGVVVQDIEGKEHELAVCCKCRTRNGVF